MVVGALILLAGMVIGYLVAIYLSLKPKQETSKQFAEDPYEKYKNTDGLYSRKVVKEKLRARRESG